MIAKMIVSFFLLVTGMSMIIIYIMDIGKNPDIDLSVGFFKAREKAGQNIFWFHIVAELTTGLLLITSGFILILSDTSLNPVVHFALGALFYSSLNSLGWAFSNKDRRKYAIPMLSGLMISMASIIVLIA